MCYSFLVYIFLLEKVMSQFLHCWIWYEVNCTVNNKIQSNIIQCLQIKNTFLYISYQSNSQCSHYFLKIIQHQVFMFWWSATGNHYSYPFQLNSSIDMNDQVLIEHKFHQQFNLHTWIHWTNLWVYASQSAMTYQFSIYFHSCIIHSI